MYSKICISTHNVFFIKYQAKTSNFGTCFVYLFAIRFHCFRESLVIVKFSSVRTNKEFLSLPYKLT